MFDDGQNVYNFEQLPTCGRAFCLIAHCDLLFTMITNALFIT